MAAVTITYLEMLSPAELRPKRCDDPRFSIRECTVKQWEFNRFLYFTVGGLWAWSDKRGWSDAQWRAYAESDRLRTFAAYYDGSPAGYFDLHESDGPEIEIAYFGLMPAFYSRGFGGAMLTGALEEAWKSQPRRVWVHTCTDDHEAALPNYRARGMTIYKIETTGAQSAADRLVKIGCTSLATLMLGGAFAATPGAEVDFSRDVQPLLADRCLKCHGPEKQKGGLRLDAKVPAMKGGDDGKVIEPGRSEESKLIHFVEGRDADKVMPPKGERLTAAEVGLLRAWIDQGANWPADAKPVRSEHWSLQPLRGAKGDGIDAFVSARLAKDGLALSPKADRATLIRRLSFDLIGLPPSPEEIEAFAKSESPRAYEELVDRLLASPHYGERWGRHWLDVARYTESQGFEYDRIRDNAWQYRDYVIKSFNDDKPYDRFMREQIAGDVVEPVTSDGVVGASLLVCGPWDQAANIQANVTQKKISREDELEDLISVVGQSFLGLTINCARCHSHKFDPIPHEEYYRIKSVFEGVKHGERPLPDRPGVTYAGTRVQPDPTRRLKRGDVTSPDEIVTPGALSAIVDLDPDFGLSADAPEAQRRLKFADWLADPRNPLPARVMANRVWHLHFGQGLVTTPNDFGASGARPSHPELLDWLAAKLIESGWSVKALHRLIVNSATYRQSSAFNEKAAAADADNQLLWRFTPRRLEAEAVRDAMLAVSGQLNPAIGGPSFRPFTITEFNAAFYHLVDRPDPEFNRRTVYRANVNSGKDPMLEAFDCPDPSVKTPRRGVTTTPLQALELMNNSFVQRQARFLADRAMKLGGEDVSAAVQSAYRIALGRAPSADETARASAAAKERGIASVCWALLNSTEFVYVR